MNAEAFPWLTTAPEIYNALNGYGMNPYLDEEEIAWGNGLALPIDSDVFQLPVNEVVTMTAEATMDVPDSVMLDTPNGPQEVEMFNIAPRVQPSPIFEGDQFFDPWNRQEF